MLSKKHYEAIASIIKDNSELVNDTIVDEDGIKTMVINRDGFINDITSYFNSDNSAFSWERFVNACDDV
tara:strand:+ start:1241 stop:1447 length:207 start_codon:yes stop_codon:yes gene_type:complete